MLSKVYSQDIINFYKWCQIYIFEALEPNPGVFFGSVVKYYIKLYQTLFQTTIVL